MSEPKDKTPMTALCGKCEHTWAAAWLPMEAAKFARATRNLHCPACGADPKNVFFAPPGLLRSLKAGRAL